MTVSGIPACKSGASRLYIDLADGHIVEFWTRLLEIRVERIAHAVSCVGDDAHDVQVFLGNQDGQNGTPECGTS